MLKKYRLIIYTFLCFYMILWSVVIVIYGVIFCYLPLGGWIMAFQNYKPKDGLLHSTFVGLDKFKQLFSDDTFIRVIRNTLAMGVINLVVTFIAAIVFAILLNEVKSNGGRRRYRRSRICRIFSRGSLLQVFCMMRCQVRVLSMNCC